MEITESDVVVEHCARESKLQSVTVLRNRMLE